MKNKKTLAVRLAIIILIVAILPYGCTYTDKCNNSLVSEVNALVPDDSNRGEYDTPPAENFPDPKVAAHDSYAPMNNLQIKDNMEGADVKIIASGNGVERYTTIADGDVQYRNANIEEVDASLAQGYFEGNTDDGKTNNIGLEDYMYKSMRGTGEDKYFGGIAIKFKGSSGNYTDDPETNYITRWVDNSKDAWWHFQWYYENGWLAKDMKLSTTTMNVKLEYTNVGYYKGRKISAFATIRVTPSKNRNETNSWDEGDNVNDAAYDGTYYPMIQVSKSLYRGWVWQNVKYFNVDLEFFYADDANKEIIPLAQNNDGSLGYDALYADYYVINSLNATTDSCADGEKYPHYIGPEYVLPEQPVSNVYIVDAYKNSNDVELTSNIKKAYQNHEDEPTSYGYNGGTNEEWVDDDQTKDGWAQNSVMIMPKASTSFNFTLGQLPREPYNEIGAGENSSKRHTSSMWATISTSPFTKERTPINIVVSKEWDCDSAKYANVESVTCTLYRKHISTDENGEQVVELKKVQSVDLTYSDGWKSQFSTIAKLDEGYSYIVKETVNYTTESGNKYGFTSVSNEITAEQTQTGTIQVDGSYTIDTPITITNTPILGKINIVKKDDSGDTLKGVSFRLDKADADWEVKETVGVVQETDDKGKIVFENLDMGNYLLTEVNTSKGYVLLKNPIQITIPYKKDENTEVYELTYTVSNGQAFSLPQTGVSSYEWYITLGMFMIIVTGFLLSQKNNKRKI